MFCRDCGKQLAEGAQFCDGCGARQQTPQMQQPVAATRSRVNVTVIAVVAVAVLLVAGAGWAVFLRPANASDYENQVSDAVGGVLDVPVDIAMTLTEVAGSSSAPMGDGDISALRTTVDASAKTIADARDKIDALRPPDEYKRAHEDALAALDELSAVAKGYLRIVERIDPGDTQGDVSSEFGDEFYAGAQDASRAYSDLNGALDEMGLDGIDVEQLIDGNLY
jgi:hypothetical protein